jgi:hypothetical protein
VSQLVVPRHALDVHDSVRRQRRIRLVLPHLRKGNAMSGNRRHAGGVASAMANLRKIDERIATYRKVPMTMPHCAAHPRCYDQPKFNVTGVLGDYCEKHADELIAKRERFPFELRSQSSEAK